MSPHRLPAPLLRVVLDANVLAYLTLIRLLLRLAHYERIFLPFWSQKLLEETWRTYAVKLRQGEPYASARLAEIVIGFPDALQSDLEPLIDQCTNDAKDRHVLAAAIKAQAQVIVTFNQKHFRPEHLEQWGIVAQNPNDFLIELYSKHPAAMWRQLKFAADEKRMELGDFVHGYTEQLARFKAALLADLP